MDPEPDEFRHFPESSRLVNNDFAHPFSSPIHNQTINRPLNDLPGRFESVQSMKLDIDMNKILLNNNIKTEIIENENKVQEHAFDNDKNQEEYFPIEEFLINIKLIDIDEFDLIIKNLNKKFKYLEIEFERTQRITTHLEK